MLELIFFFLVSPNVFASTHLELIGDYTLPKSSTFKNTLIGGLSGLYNEDNLIWAVSDDRGKYNNPRIYGFSLTGLDGLSDFRAIPSKVLFLKNEARRNSKKLNVDFESLVPFEKGWLISSEGNYSPKTSKAPSLIYFDMQGKFIREIQWPKKFIPNFSSKIKKGLRSNYAFEGLSISPDQKYLFAIHEAPIYQEAPIWHPGDEGILNLLRFKILANAIKIDIDREIQYKLDSYKDKGAKVLVSGVSEIVAVTNNKILVLERAVLLNSVEFLHYESKIYEVSLDNPTEKKLVLDLTNIKKLLKTTKELDNFEGMALGPIVNNQPTLIMVSDDNFNPLENTIWLLFKINMEL